jgi:hypothetical protein
MFAVGVNKMHYYRIFGKKFDGANWIDLPTSTGFRPREGKNYNRNLFIDKYLSITVQNGLIHFGLEAGFGAYGLVGPELVYICFDPAQNKYTTIKNIFTNVVNETYKGMDLLVDTYGNKHLMFYNKLHYKTISGGPITWIYLEDDQINIISDISTPKVFVTNPLGDQVYVPLERSREIAPVYSGSLEASLAGSYSLNISARDWKVNAVDLNQVIDVVNNQTSYKVTDWSTGCQLDFSIKNTGTTPLKNWSLEFDYAFPITSIWEADYTQVGNHYMVTPPAWGKDIDPGKEVRFGFVGSLDALFIDPANITLKSN